MDSEPQPADGSAPWQAFRGEAGEGVCSRHLDLSRWGPWLEHLPELVRSATAREISYLSLLSTGRRTYQVPGPDGRPLVVKCYPGAARGESPASSAPAGVADCWSAFCRHRELWLRGLPVPEPLAFMQTGGAAYTITCLLEGCETLFHFAFENLYRRRSPAERLGAWVKTTVGAVVRFHQAGYAHGDLHHHNVMVRSLGPADGLEVFFTDFDACQPSEGTVPNADQLMDLASLGASLYQLVPESWLRKALACYFQRCRLPRGERPRCLQTVRSGHDSFLQQYQANFDRVEGYYFSEAESQVQPVESIR